MKSKQLSDIASVHSGYLFKKGVTEESDGIPVIQIRNMKSNEGIDWDNVVRTSLERKPKQFLENGDVIFMSKGQENYAYAITGLQAPVVSTSHFLYIKPNQEVMIPKYLAMQLNAQGAKQYFLEHFRGKGKKHLTKVDVSNVKISVPSIEIQKKYVQIFEVLDKDTRELEALLKCNNLIKEHMISGGIAEAEKYLMDRDNLLHDNHFAEHSELIFALLKYISLPDTKKGGRFQRKNTL